MLGETLIQREEIALTSEILSDAPGVQSVELSHIDMVT